MPHEESIQLLRKPRLKKKEYNAAFRSHVPNDELKACFNELGMDSGPLSPPPPSPRISRKGVDFSPDPSRPTLTSPPLSAGLASTVIRMSSYAQGVLDPTWIYASRNSNRANVPQQPLPLHRRPKGPDPLPARPVKHNRDFLKKYIYADEYDMAPMPQFTLHTFIRTMSATAEVTPMKLQQAILSKENYKKITKLLAKRLFDTNAATVKATSWQFDFKASNFEDKSSRVPWHQAMIEMAVTLKEYLARSAQMHVKPKIRKNLPRYLPGLPIGTAPHAEILLVEQSSPLPDPHAHSPEKLSETSPDVEQLTKEMVAMYPSPPVPNSALKRHQDVNSELTRLQSGELFLKGESIGGHAAADPTDFSPSPSHVQPSRRSFVASGEPNYFQDSWRTREPFVTRLQDQISLSEAAVLDAMCHGGVALSLKAHFISELPEIYSMVDTLVYVNLSFNHFMDVPSVIFSLQNLEILKLRNNPIRRLPAAMAALRNLRIFVASFCLIGDIAEDFWRLDNLEFLDLSFNNLKRCLSRNLRNLRKLRELNLEGNSLIALPGAAIRLKIVRLRVVNNFMNPVFWPDNAKNSPDKLLDICLTLVNKEKFARFADYQLSVTDAQKLHTLLSGSSVCDMCKGPLFGAGLKILRPCSIFGVRNLPFLFRVCTEECRYIFNGSVIQLSDLLYGESDAGSDFYNYS